MMPSPRTTHAAVRPSSPLSPLSPGYKSSQVDHLQSTQPWSKQSRSPNKQRRPPTNSLKLPPLPRFHPANFPSTSSSQQPTPDGQSPNQPPMSPRSHQRMYSDVQRKFYHHQRELFQDSTRGAPFSNSGPKPAGPRLAPLGSPGPVTPLELESEGGYLLAGSRGEGRDKADLVDELIRKETRRHRD